MCVKGGTIDVDDFRVGNAVGSNGNHTLDSGESLSAFVESIGHYGTGTFNQSGGSNLTTNLRLGLESGSSGTYNLNSGVLSAQSEYIGYVGTAIFNQTGGTNMLSHSLSIGGNSTGNGTYNLSGGTLNVGGNIVNGDGTGSLNIDGGTLNMTSVTGGVINVDTFHVGNITGSSGSHILGSGESLSATTETIGNYGTGVFTQAGGANSVTNDLTLGKFTGSNGAYNLNGGALNVGGNIVNAYSGKADHSIRSKPIT